jgi:hypothetical protein
VIDTFFAQESQAKGSLIVTQRLFQVDPMAALFAIGYPEWARNSESIKRMPRSWAKRSEGGR